jgi:agmatine deiminase
MPAEWEPHEATWVAWPHNRSDWPGKYPAIPWVYADIVRHLARVEEVHIVVNDAGWERAARRALERSDVRPDNIRFHRWPTDRGWTRDSGPIIVRSEDEELVALNWRFNAWAKYPDWKKDDKLAERIARAVGVRQLLPVVPHPAAKPGARMGHPQRMVLEGGSIDVNGCGTMLTTEECLLSEVQQRNPGVSREQLESVFAQYLGVRKVIWLGRGIAGDDTHGHVDDLARFVAPGTVVTAVEQNPKDENYAPLQENLERLRAATDQDSRRLEVIELPLPAPVVFNKRRLPASYANFYIANELVLVPTFNDANDRRALGILAECFPGRKVVGIHCGDLIWGLGAIHCMTQQQPRAGR